MVLEETARQRELDILAQRYQTTLAMRASEEKATEVEYAASLARYGASKRQSGEGGGSDCVWAGTAKESVAAGRGLLTSASEGHPDYAGDLGVLGGHPQPFDGFPTRPQHGAARCSAPWAGAGQAAQDGVG